jgi:hypothetical protein
MTEEFNATWQALGRMILALQNLDLQEYGLANRSESAQQIIKLEKNTIVQNLTIG